MGEKRYISVVADYLPDGRVRPVSVKFADGRAFAVEKIINVTDMTMTKHNGAAIRYYVKVGGSEHYLFFEDAPRNPAPGWFVRDGGIIDT